MLNHQDEDLSHLFYYTLLYTFLLCASFMYQSTNEHHDIIIRDMSRLRGFVKLKKIQKSEKISEVGGWVKPNSDLYFLGGKFMLFSCFHVIQKEIKNWIRGWMGGV